MTDKIIKVGDQRGLLKPTLQITVFSILGILISFVTQIIVAANFGATMERDAYFAAVAVPFYITAVLLGSLPVTFIPILIKYETKKSKEEVWKVASTFTNLTFLVLLGISLLGFIFARQLISVTAPGFKGEELSLTAALLRIIFPSIIFRGLSSLLSSIYYAHHQFLRPAIVPVINTLLILLSVIALARYWGIKSLAFGNLVGAIVGFFILAPVLFKQGRYCFSWDFHNEGVIQIIKVMSPLVFAGVFYRATTVIQRMIASTLPTGSISYLGYAGEITRALGTIATVGISTTIFPVMAKSWAENDLAKVREYFAKGVRIIMLTTFPIAAVFIALRIPIIQVVFERGAFDHKTTIAVANVLLILLAYFIFSSIGNILWKGFYISQKTKLVAGIDVALMVVYIMLAYFLVRYLSYIGLALALSLQFSLGGLVGMVGMRIIYKGLNGKKLVDGFLKILSASLASIVGIYYSFQLFQTRVNLILSVVLASTIGFILYSLLIVYIFKLDEAISAREKGMGFIKSKFCF